METTRPSAMAHPYMAEYTPSEASIVSSVPILVRPSSRNLRLVRSRTRRGPAPIDAFFHPPATRPRRPRPVHRAHECALEYCGTARCLGAAGVAIAPTALALR